MNGKGKLAVLGIAAAAWLSAHSGETRDPEIDRLAARQLTHPEAHDQLLQAEEARRYRDGPLPLLCAAVGLTALLFGPDLARRFHPNMTPIEEN